MATSQLLIDAETNHQMNLVRYSQGRANALIPYMKKIVAYIEGRLAKEGETIATKKRLNSILKDVRSEMDKYYSQFDRREFQPSLDDVMKQEISFQQDSVDAVAVDYTSTKPTQKQAMAAAYNNPLVVGSKGGAVDFSTYTKDWKPREIKRVADRISAGFATGETVSAISRAVVGLKSQKYADGILNISRANIQGMVKTSVMHMSSATKNAFNQENKDLIIGVRDVATLDSRTSAECRSRDGNVYLFEDYGKNHPSPPYHPNACLKGTMITTRDGLVAIEDVKVGDYVLTHTGRYMRVNTVMARPHTESSVDLVDNLGRSVSLTDEHPVLTLVDGWKTAGDIKVGDVMFNNSKQLIDVKVPSASKVANTILLNSHNIETSVTDELISYGIFSCSAGVSSAINLDGGIADNEVSDKLTTDYSLVVEGNSMLGKDVKNNGFVSGKVLLHVSGSALNSLEFNLPVVNGVVSKHTFARFFGALLCEFGINSAPMIVTRRCWRELLAGVNRVLSASGFNAKLDASLSERVVREAILSLDKPEAFAFLPMLDSNDGFDFTIADCHNKSPNDLWFNSTITSIVENNINEMVYNLSVEEDETYIADGFLVHNCRTTQVPELSSEYDFLKESKTRPAVTESNGKTKAEEVPATQTYYTWLKNQPKAVVDDALGIEKGKIFRNAGLSPEEFKKASTDQFYNPLTIEQMSAKDDKIAKYLQKQQ